MFKMWLKEKEQFNEIAFDNEGIIRAVLAKSTYQPGRYLPIPQQVFREPNLFALEVRCAKESAVILAAHMIHAKHGIGVGSTFVSPDGELDDIGEAVPELSRFGFWLLANDLQMAANFLNTWKRLFSPEDIYYLERLPTKVKIYNLFGMLN